MSLTCGYGDGDHPWYYFPPEDYQPFKANRRKACCSCKALIEQGATSAKFNRGRYPKNDLEERIHGEEVPMAPKWMCEECADIYFNLTELGYCITLGVESMQSLLDQYKEMHGRKSV